VKAEPLRARLRRKLGDRVAVLDAVVREAADHDAAVYLVGGPVRDLLLGAPIGDLDLLLSGSLDKIARGVAARLRGKEILRPQFLTASVAAGEWSVDLARARRERYARPGALPDVEPAPVDADLARRDFTISAMALPLETASGPDLLDPFGGRRDLAARCVRVLHAESFRDDPTRLLRAVRYAARLGFRIEPSTARRFRTALAERALDTLSGDRIAHEIERILTEAEPGRALLRADRSGLLEGIESGWSLAPESRAALGRFERARAKPPWPESADPEVRLACGLRLLLLGSPTRVRGRVLRRLGYSGRRARRIDEDLTALGAMLRRLDAQPSPGRVDALLQGATEPFLLLAYCAGDAAARRTVQRFARLDRHRASPLGGHAARRLGLEGPAIGDLLRAARRRTLDGEDVDERWIRRWMARRRQLR
jgi:tRNA nucleotidyltransferase (CCA-adding enzyme)